MPPPVLTDPRGVPSPFEQRLKGLLSQRKSTVKPQGSLLPAPVIGMPERPPGIPDADWQRINAQLQGKPTPPFVPPKPKGATAEEWKKLQENVPWLQGSPRQPWQQRNPYGVGADTRPSQDPAVWGINPIEQAESAIYEGIGGAIDVGASWITDAAKVARDLGIRTGIYLLFGILFILFVYMFVSGGTPSDFGRAVSRQAGGSLPGG